MIDIKKWREDIPGLKSAMESRGLDSSAADGIVELDKKRRAILGQVEELRSKRNTVSKQIGELMKKGEPVDEIKAETKRIGEQIKAFDVDLSSIEEELNDIALSIPNIPLPDVPKGLSEEDNVVVEVVGEPKKFSFTPKPHWEIGTDLDILDNERAVKLSGARFNMFKGDLAKLQRSLISYMIDFHTKNGFKEVFAPVIVNASTALGTGQLPKFAGDMYKIEGEDQYLISTNEITLINYHAGETIPAETLPAKYAGFALCFRKEAGAAGRDNRGLIRVHQFEKVEMVSFCKPEDSDFELNTMTHHAGDLLKSLGLPYRISLMCTGDMSGFSAAKSYDLEMWLPSYEKYVEVSSCSNCSDFQARRAGIKYKEAQGKKAEFVHTLNGSGLAVGRTMAGILENHQLEDGTVKIPEVLVPYMGKEIISG